MDNPRGAETASHLLSLPRELRDVIYHYLFLHGYIVKGIFPAVSIHDILAGNDSTKAGPYNTEGLSLIARYRLEHPYTNAHRNTVPWEFTNPTWLLTNKTIFREGFEQLARNVEWLCGEEDLSSLSKAGSPRVFSIPIPPPLPMRMEIHMDDKVSTSYGLSQVAAIMRHYNIQMERIRLVWRTSVHSHLLPSSTDIWSASLMSDIKKMFHGVHIEQWQVGVEEYHYKRRRWSLFEWSGTGNGAMVVRAHHVEALHQVRPRPSSEWRNEMESHNIELVKLFLQERGKHASGKSSLEYFKERREILERLETRRCITERLRVRGF